VEEVEAVAAISWLLAPLHLEVPAAVAAVAMKCGSTPLTWARPRRTPWERVALQEARARAPVAALEVSAAHRHSVARPFRNTSHTAEVAVDQVAQVLLAAAVAVA